MFSVIYAVLLLLLSPTTKASAAAPATATGGRNYCTTSCGSIGIPYPFGVEPGCYRDEGFKLTCTNDSSLFVGYGTEVLEIDLANGTMLINVQGVDQSNLALPDPRSSSNNSYLTGTWAVIGQGDLGPYVLSDTRNKLAVVGCDVQVLLMALDDDILSTCAAFCSPVSENRYLVASPDCSGVGCCQATIPTGLAIYQLQFRRFNGSWSGDQATVYIADAERLSSYRMDGQLPWALPAVAEWVISDTTCPGNMTSPECLSSHSFCQNSTTFGSGHRCHCSPGYDGNPYVFNGCNDINECQFPEIYPCFGDCNNTQGGYLCHCPVGFDGDAYTPNGCKDVDECAHPETYSCYGICVNVPGTFDCRCPQGTNGDPFRKGGCITNRNSLSGSIIALIVSGGFVLLLVALGAPFITREIQLQRVKRMKQKYFKQNHGLLLQHLVSKKTDIGERMIITLREIEKATDNFDKTREVGGGGHGIVYKGILNLNVVAIKKSKIAVQREIDDFINEVAILSQVNHRNVVKLMGCCLETEVPLLVYEFISNGPLYHHLHVEGPISLSWDNRLRIALEVARALSYLHSATSMPIYHRDIKSSNILLDDNLIAKVSDFGASTGREPSFTPGGEPPLVPVPHPGASIRD